MPDMIRDGSIRSILPLELLISLNFISCNFDSSDNFVMPVHHTILSFDYEKVIFLLKRPQSFHFLCDAYCGLQCSQSTLR